MMKKWCLVLAGFLLTVPPAFAGQSVNNFRCGSNLVSPGESMGSVKMKCGEPSMRSDATTGSGNVKVEVWYYNCGGGNFNHILTFKAMTLVGITKTDERGSGVSDWDKAR